MSNLSLIKFFYLVVITFTRVIQYVPINSVYIIIKAKKILIALKLRLSNYNQYDHQHHNTFI